MTQLEIGLCVSMCKAIAELSDFDRGRLLGYGEGLVDRVESDRRKASDNQADRTKEEN